MSGCDRRTDPAGRAMRRSLGACGFRRRLAADLSSRLACARRRSAPCGSVGRAAQFRRAFRFRRLPISVSDLTGSILALSTCGVSTRAEMSVRDASAERAFRRVQRTRPGHRARHQHLRRALMAEIAIGEAHARDRAAEAALVFLVEIEARLERNALDRRADGLAADLQRIAGQAACGAPDRSRRTAPRLPRPCRRVSRPAPRVPSKQVNANTLPATNLRASSAFIICPARAGAITAPAVNGSQHETRKHAVTPTLLSAGNA